MTDTIRRSLSGEDPQSFIPLAETLAEDRGTPPGCLVESSTADLGNATVPKAHFTSREWAAKEAAKLWKHTWQMACRENDIPNVGDQLAYDIVGQSVIVVRVGPDEVKAFHNACRHRGNRLVEGCTNAGEIRCSFHAWTWHLDGSLKRIPCQWDFPEVCEAEVGLKECPSACWNGLVFVNLDSAAEPFEDFLGETVLRHFESWDQTHSWKAAHVGKIIPANWKLALEAFMEVYHPVGTHPNSMYFSYDCSTQYDFYGPHARALTRTGMASPHLGDLVDPQDVVEASLSAAFAGLYGEVPADYEFPQLQEGQTPRELLSDFIRETLGNMTGVDYGRKSDAEMLDAIEYFVFPNTLIFVGCILPVTFRFRPVDDDPGRCLFEVMVLMELREDVPLPPDMPFRLSSPDEPWSAAAEMGGLGTVLDEDMVNINKLQRGLQSDGIDEVILANYQERNIRNFHQHLARIVES